VVASIAEGCRQAGCALIGGETAEMPGMYAPGDYDLAGFCVGAVERGEQLTGAAIRPGDVLLGLPSSGVHSNGFSLVRRCRGERLEARPPCPLRSRATARRPAAGADPHLREEPAARDPRRADPRPRPHHRRRPAREHPARAARRLPRGVDADAWTLPPLFAWLQAGGAIEPEELARTFNCGIGMVVVVAPDQADAVTAAGSRRRARRCTASAASKKARAAAPSAAPTRAGAPRGAWSATHHHG
jgi:phosphoribosylformylglycinamidine cyclo-ligase